VFDRKSVMPWVLADSILEEGKVWGMAGFAVVCTPQVARSQFVSL